MPAVRTALGAILSLLGLSGLFLFGFWQDALAGLSADGVIVPHTWLMLRIMLISLAAPGLLLLAWPWLRAPLGHLDARLQAVSPRGFVTGLLLAAAVIRFAWVLAIPTHIYADWETYDELAWRLAQTGDFAESDHFTMYRPPAYPFVLSLMYRVFGHHALPALFLNALFGVAIVWLTYLLARRLIGEPGARWAALLLVAFPSQIVYINLLCTEPLFTMLLVASLYLFVRALDGDRRFYLTLAASGALLGLATLARSLTILLPVLMVPLLFTQKRRLATATLGSVVMIATLTVTVWPWMLRNYELNGRFTVSTNGGTVFYIGNNPMATFGFNVPDPERFTCHSIEDEARIDSMGYAEGLAYIRRAPLAFVKRGIMKTGFLMGSDTEGWSWDLTKAADAGRFDRHVWFGILMQSYWNVFILMTLIGAAAVLKSPRAISPGMWLMLGVIVYWMAVHFAFFGEGRYHYPIVSLMAVFAACGRNLIPETTRL